jgi:hypothetical protein
MKAIEQKEAEIAEEFALIVFSASSFSIVFYFFVSFVPLWFHLFQIERFDADCFIASQRDGNGLPVGAGGAACGCDARVRLSSNGGGAAGGDPVVHSGGCHEP